MSKRITYIPNRVIDTNGISDGAVIDVFETGTTTRVSIYSDEALTTPISNPYTVPSGAAVPKMYHGEVSDVRVRVTQDNGTVISDDDPYVTFVADADLSSNALGKGADLVGLYGSGTVQDALPFVVPTGLTHTEVQAAIDTGRTVYLGDQTKTYEIGVPLTMNAGQRIFADGAILQASTVINEILVAANFAQIEGVTFDCNNTQPASGVPITHTGAARGVQVRDVTGCRFRRCTFTKYIRGASVTSSAVGVKCYDHVFENCVVEAGYTWIAGRSSNLQLGAYVGSEAQPVVTDIANYSTVESDCEDVYDIRFINWRAFEGQYGLALHRCSNVSVIGGSFSRMSRGISMQHQPRGITIMGNLFVDLDSTGVHMAQGANQISVVGNRIRGTMANDNVGIQAYYGCYDITIADNLIDSRFNLWDGGVSSETRTPGSGIRLGQQVENVTIRGNKIRGFTTGILIKSTIYEAAITPSDDNYYNTGFRNITISGNTIIGDYFGSASGYKGSFPQNGSYGIRAQISGSWEDVAQGGWHVSGVVISDNECDGVGYSYVIDTTAMSGGATPPVYSNFGVRLFNNRALNDLLNVSRSTVTTPLSVVYEGNTWRDEQNWTPTLIGTTTPGVQTYSNQVGRWVARGGRVFLQGRIALSAKDAGIAGNPVIGGLPASVKSGSNENRAGSVSLWGGWTLSASYTSLGAFAEPGTSHLRIVRNGSGVSAAYPSVSEMGATAQIDFSCEYEPA